MGENVTSCPRCQGPCLPKEGRGYRLLVCRSCGGLFARGVKPDGVAELPAGTLSEAETASSAAALLPDEAGRVACPDCRRRLARYRLEEAGVELDACPSHGVWFDRDELPKLVAGVPKGSRPKAVLVAAAGAAVAAGAAGVALAAASTASAAAAASTAATAGAGSSALGAVGEVVGEVVIEGVVDVGVELIGELISGIFS